MQEGRSKTVQHNKAPYKGANVKRKRLEILSFTSWFELKTKLAKMLA